MLLQRKLLLHKSVFFACSGLFTLIAPALVFGQTDPKTPATTAPPAAAAPARTDSFPDPKPVGPLPFPINDNRGDFLSSGARSTYDFKTPSNIKDSIAYDPASNMYTVYEKIGNKYYRTPVSYTSEEYWKLRGRQAEVAYWQKRANTMNLLNRGALRPKLKLYDGLFNRLFGNGKIEIAPQGNVDIMAGYQGQKINNPTLPERARNSGGFDFNMNAQVNVNANIGDKLKFPISYNTLANFGQENQLKLDYTGMDDEIIKRFEAGVVQFSSRSTFIPGSQQLFGLKTQLQFGKLNVTAVIANQKSQRQSVNLQGGAASQPIEVKADEYEENRHFLLGSYFKDNYNKVLARIPALTTPVQILRLEVWVTNRNGTTTNTRDIVGLMDLGESAPYRRDIINPMVSYNGLPGNNANDLYAKLKADPSYRQPSLIFNALQNLNLQPVQDFEKTFARKLDSTQYYFNRQAGYISLSQPLLADEVLAVAYQYSYNGQILQVGEFSQDLPPDSAVATQKVLFLKLLKATSQRPNLPIWQWMMKNVYSVGYGTLSAQDFKINLLYQEPGQGWKRYVPFGDKNQGTPVLSLVNLDRLNNQNDPQPDGVFDFVEGYTVLSQYSRIVFPVLEPFGRDLAANIYNDTTNPRIKDTLYYALYDTIKAVAQQFPNLNRFVLKGSAKTSGSSDISIGYNIPKGSVTVTAGGQTLLEGTDYDINYDLGTIKIINQAILNAGLPVQVNFENNAAFGIQQRNYMALRLDYLAKDKLKEQLAFGATMVKLSERPFFTKNNLGEEPISNKMYGLDVSYRKDLPRLTKILDKLPFYSTTAPSSINFYAEGAMLKPGHAPQIGAGSAGTVYLDDFEGSRSGIDLRFPAISWALASTPRNATDNVDTSRILFPEASAASPSIDYGKNRAKLAWYQIEPTLQQFKGANNPLGENRSELSDPRTRLIRQSEIFPQRTTDYGQNQLTTFDLAFYPAEKGPYNYDNSAATVDADNRLRNPTTRWGGLMRNVDQTDFETANIEFIEFWMQDPYVPFGTRNEGNSNGGKLYFNLGNVSEDILKDGKRFYENGLPTPTQNQPTDTSIWGRVPLNPIQVTNAFSNEPADRPYQDVGLDGNNDDSERVKLATYIGDLSGIVNAAALAQVQNDPAQDNYVWYRDPSFTSNDGIVKRYKSFNSPQGNSAISDGASTFSSAATLYPDGEDLNRDNTMNETEQYFQYTVDIKPEAQMPIGQNFIVDKKVVPITGLPDGSAREETWYQFRIPIGSFNKRIGNIPDFKSIRFIRMFLTGFDSSVVIRFGKLELTRNIWRRFQFNLDTTGNYTPVTTAATLDVNGVNIEENDKRTPLPYRTPRDIQRQQIQSNNGVNLLQNEQSMSLKFCGLGPKDARAVQQTFANRDLRQFGKLSMYIHAENAVKEANNIKDGEMNAVIRIGTDFAGNYYEVKIPLRMTALDAATRIDPNTDEYNDTLWNPLNSLDLDLTTLPKLKAQRNSSGEPLNKPYGQLQPNGHTYSIMGDPNLGEVRGILIGVENAKNPTLACGEVWVNELRLTSINEKGGYAAMARADITLADLGTITGSIAMHTTGFGTLEQRVNERFRDNLTQFDVAANLELGKLLPKKAAISIPVFASYSQTVSKPEYDPFDMDIKLNDKLGAATSSAQKDSIKNAAVDFTSTTTVNFTNVRRNRTGTGTPKIYDIENFDISYSYFNTKSHNPLIESNEVTRHRGALGYNFAPQPKFVEPFKKIKFFKKRKTHWFDLIKDFNFNYAPAQLSFRTDIQRQFGAVRPRSIGSDKYKIPETYDKYLVLQRDYIFRWNLTRSFNFDFTATNNSRVDEPYGRLDTKEKKDTVWRRLLSGGRNTLYNHTANFSYTLPTTKFPLLDWTAANLKYQATYRWIGASRLAIELGNILENSQTKEATLQFDFTKLYSKFKFFRALDQPPGQGGPKAAPQTRTDTVYRWVKKDGVKVKEVKRLKVKKIKDPNALPDLGLAARIFGKLVTSVKQVNLSVSETGNTRLPGYMDSTQAVGQNWNSMQPGLDFVLGMQPDTGWLNRAGRNNLISKDSFFNTIFQQSYNQRLALTAQLEPVRDLTISVNLTKTFSKTYSELFKDTTGTGNNFGHLSPYSGGSFDVSFIAFNTMFGAFNPNQLSETFVKFQENRKVISQRLGLANKYNQDIGNINPDAEGYYYGYGKYATDVLIPAFVAAYTGKDPNKIGLIDQSNPKISSNPFKKFLPMPNWKIDYTGLSRIKGLDKIFSNVTLSHGYTGSLSMNGFNSALLYQDVSRYSYPSFYDTTSKNYIPYFLIPNITIQEQFAPLFGIDMMFTNQFQGKLEITKQRTLSLSLVDFQLSETRSTEFAIGAGYRKKGLKLPGFIKLPKFLSNNNSSKLDNEINFRFDFRIRDNVTVNNRLDQDATLPTSGSKEITLSPSIDYFLSSRVNVKLFFDQRRVTPYISSSPPTVNTRAGFQVRISLAQ